MSDRYLRLIVSSVPEIRASTNTGVGSLKLLVSILCCLAFCSCKPSKKVFAEQEKALASSQAMVVSARKEASDIGIQILTQGGNAFDAMAATDFALAVCFPFAGNLGGGGFIVYRMNDGTIGSVDYREKAPLRSNRNMYLDQNGEVIDRLSTEGALASGIPGTVKGILDTHQRFGLLDREQVMKPAIELAQKGFHLTALQARQWNRFRADFLRINGHSIPLTEKEKWKEGDLVQLPVLARTLIRIAEKGSDAFYKGILSDLLINELNEQGGIFSKKDLIQYQVKKRTPIRFQYKNLDIISMNLPSSGGICLAQIMKMVEPYDLSHLQPTDVEYVHLLTEAERRAYSDRAFWLGDADFVEVPIEKLVSEHYLATKMNDFDQNKASRSKDLSSGRWLKSPEETTHYSIIDQWGNAIAVTTTINGAYGSKLYIDSLGFFMNNEMDDFSIKPGFPNSYGLVGAEANAIVPEKRMLSSMTPTIVEQNGKLKMVVGTPGGSTIITSVLQVILNVFEFDMNIQAAVDHPRFHHQWLPDEIQFEEDRFSSELLTQLKEKGHTVKIRNSKIIGNVNAILVQENGELKCGADTRGDNYGAQMIFPSIKE